MVVWLGMAFYARYRQEYWVELWLGKGCAAPSEEALKEEASSNIWLDSEGILGSSKASLRVRVWSYSSFGTGLCCRTVCESLMSTLKHSYLESVGALQ